jgi:hypothetical protein
LLVDVYGEGVTVGVVDVVAIVVGVVVEAELLVWVDEMLDKVELVDWVVDGVELVLAVVAAEVVGGEEVGALVGVVGGVGVDNVTGGVDADDEGPARVGVRGVVVSGLDMI